MLEKIDIYEYDKQISNIRQRIKKAKICEANKKAISKFHDFLRARGLSKAREMFYLRRLYDIGRWIRKEDFKKMTRDDMEKLVAMINSKRYSEWTKHGYKIALKVFYRWLSNGKAKGDYPDVVGWIEAKKGNNHRLPEDLLTEKDVQKLIEECNHPRNRALIGVLWESGTRIGELLTLRIKNVKFDKYGAVLKVSGKTGDRRIRIVTYAPLLQLWLAVHPGKDNPNSFVWTALGNRTKVLNHRGTYQMIANVTRKARIKKKTNPHSFRHSRASFLANHLTEAQMKEYFGWVQGSDMASIYVHLSGRDVDKALLSMYGLAKEKKEEPKPLPVKCPRCEQLNPAEKELCQKCASPLTVEKGTQLLMDSEKEDRIVHALLSELVKDGGFKQQIVEAIKRLDLGDKIEQT